MKLPRKIPYDVIKHLRNVNIFKKNHCCHGNKTGGVLKFSQFNPPSPPTFIERSHLMETSVSTYQMF